MTKNHKDVGASVKARLLRLARERGEDYQLLLLRYANERLLYRLALSPHSTRFVLKGAALFTMWTGHPHRATRDIDLLGTGDASESHVREVFRDILSQNVEDDGVVFDIATLTVGPIREDQTYGGVRVALVAQIATAQVRLQIDVGFGDAVTPRATLVDFPALLEFPAPRLLAYPREKHQPRRLTRDDSNMRTMAESVDLQHMPGSVLSVHAKRVGHVFASVSTWARMIRMNGWRRPRKRIHPRHRGSGSAPNESENCCIST